MDRPEAAAAEEVNELKPELPDRTLEVIG